MRTVLYQLTFHFAELRIVVRRSQPANWTEIILLDTSMILPSIHLTWLVNVFNTAEILKSVMSVHLSVLLCNYTNAFKDTRLNILGFKKEKFIFLAAKWDRIMNLKKRINIYYITPVCASDCQPSSLFIFLIRKKKWNLRLELSEVKFTFPSTMRRKWRPCRRRTMNKSGK